MSSALGKSLKSSVRLPVKGDSVFDHQAAVAVDEGLVALPAAVQVS